MAIKQRKLKCEDKELSGKLALLMPCFRTRLYSLQTMLTYFLQSFFIKTILLKPTKLELNPVVH